MNYESEWCVTNTTGASCFALYSTQNLKQKIIESMKLGQKKGAYEQRRSEAKTDHMTAHKPLPVTVCHRFG